jgi:hypothetical protein
MGTIIRPAGNNSKIFLKIILAKILDEVIFIKVGIESVGPVGIFVFPHHLADSR